MSKIEKDSQTYFFCIKDLKTGNAVCLVTSLYDCDVSAQPMSRPRSIMYLYISWYRLAVLVYLLLIFLAISCDSKEQSSPASRILNLLGFFFIHMHPFPGTIGFIPFENNGLLCFFISKIYILLCLIRFYIYILNSSSSNLSDM